MCCINIFGCSESGSDSEEGSESSSGSEEDEDESKSESEASTKTGTCTYFFLPRLLFFKHSKALLVVFSINYMVCVRKHPADLYNACFTLLH